MLNQSTFAQNKAKISSGLTNTPFGNFVDVTLVYNDTNSILADDTIPNRSSKSKQYVEQQVYKERCTIWSWSPIGLARWCRSCMEC